MSTVEEIAGLRVVQVAGAYYEVCDMCHGKGRLREYAHVMDGVCFTCGGFGTARRVGGTPEEVAKRARTRAKARERAAAKRAEKAAARAAGKAAQAEAWLTEGEERPRLVAWLKAQPEGTRAAGLSEAYTEWGALTEGQERFARSLREEETAKAERVAAGVQVPEGKHTVAGVVTWVGTEESYFGYTTQYTRKMTVQTEEGWTVKVTVPRSVEVEKGTRVRFTATLTRSERDPLFGWGKRPTQVGVMT